MNECDSWMVNRAHGKVLKYMIVALLLVKSSYISSPWFGSYTLNLPRYFKEITRMQDIESRPASSVGPLQSMVPGASHELLEQFPPYIYIYIRIYATLVLLVWNTAPSEGLEVFGRCSSSQVHCRISRMVDFNWVLSIMVSGSLKAWVYISIHSFSMIHIYIQI